MLCAAVVIRKKMKQKYAKGGRGRRDEVDAMECERKLAQDAGQETGGRRQEASRPSCVCMNV